MKTLRPVRSLLLVAGTAAIGLLTPALYATTMEERAVLAPVQAMFDGMAKRDAAAIKEPLLHDGTMVVMRTGNLTQMTFEAFARSGANVGKDTH